MYKTRPPFDDKIYSIKSGLNPREIGASNKIAKPNPSTKIIGIHKIKIKFRESHSLNSAIDALIPTMKINTPIMRAAIPAIIKNNPP
jgi:hypothetical protein